MKSKKILIIGGGFYGLYLAKYFCERKFEIILCESENSVMTRSSYVNQARVHKGYHYNRSALTALSSSNSYDRFTKEFNEAIYTDFSSHYAISKLNSKTTAKQFENFLVNLSIPYSISSVDFKAHFDRRLIEEVYTVQEKVFDSKILRDIMLNKINQNQVEILINTTVLDVISKDDILSVTSTNKRLEKMEFHMVFNCTYSNLNLLNRKKIDLKHRVSEMALVEVPKILEKKSITIMDGSFFSLMPFPSEGKNIYSFSHVNYTHHELLKNEEELHNLYQNKNFEAVYTSNYNYMFGDAIRFMPALEDLCYRKSIWEVKSTLNSSDINDSRPIMVKADNKRKGMYSILGGKIDNIYDLEDYLNRYLN